MSVSQVVSPNLGVDFAVRIIIPNPQTDIYSIYILMG